MNKRNESVRKLVYLDKEDLEWFDKHYTRGNYSWVLTMLLKNFRASHKETPQDYARMGAEELKRMIDAGVVEEHQREGE